MDQIIEVLAIGSKVKIGDDIDATIIAINLRSTGPNYEVAYWDGRVRRTEWVQSYEVKTAIEAPKTRIGFVRA